MIKRPTFWGVFFSGDVQVLDVMITQALNLADRLQNTLPQPLLRLLTEIGHKAAEMGHNFYIVGGFVRDLLLNLSSVDVDLVVEGNAITLAKAMRDRHGGQVQSHERFGTATWYLTIEQAQQMPIVDRLDFVTARTEVYQHPALLPDVTPATIQIDLHRRDFTINSLALSLNPDNYGDVLDLFQAQTDLQHQQIRVLHDLSFVDDPTRIFRAVRYEQRFGFQIEPHTRQLIQQALPLISDLTHNRLLNELQHGFTERKPEKMMVRLSEIGALSIIQPRLVAGSWYRERCQQLRQGLPETPWETKNPTPDHYLGLLSFPLSAEDCQALIKRLHLPNETKKLLTQIQAIKVLIPSLRQPQKLSQVYNLLHPFSDEAIFLCWLSIEDTIVRQHLSLFSQTLRHIHPFTTGKDLITQFNLPPSPLIGRILTELQQAHLDREISTLDEEHRLIKHKIQPLND